MESVLTYNSGDNDFLVMWFNIFGEFSIFYEDLLILKQYFLLKNYLKSFLSDKSANFQNWNSQDSL